MARHMERRVLLVSDDEARRVALAQALAAREHEVTEESHSVEALSLLKAVQIVASAFDVIVADQSREHVRELSFVAYLRSMRCTAPVVLITSTPPVREHAKRLGAYVVTRPYQVESVCTLVDSIMEPELRRLG